MRKPFLLSIAFFSLSTLYRADTVYAAVSPERNSVRISNNLKAYSNQDWLGIAGNKTSQKYDVVKGDTLYDISGRLFGDSKVWPKIWEINNTSILNPHMIEPTTKLVFNTGSATSLPTLALQKASGISTITSHYKTNKDDRPGPVWDDHTPYPSSEWKTLPRQAWEMIPMDNPPEIDKDGFDSKNQVYLRKPITGLDLPQMVACAPIQPIATVVGTRSITKYVDRGSEVTMHIPSGAAPGAALETGKIYSLVDSEAMAIESGGRSALSYAILGKVKILGLQNGTYVGEILNIKNPVVRGAFVVPEIARLDPIRPVAAAKKVTGSLLADRKSGSFMAGQGKWVYIDRGTRDGADRGMIFRVFQNQDPKTGKRLTPGDVFVQGDIQILQGCEDFSVGMFLWSRGEVPERYEGMLLTDVSDPKVRFYFNGVASDLETAETPTLQSPDAVIEGAKPPEEEAFIGPSSNPEVITPSLDPNAKTGGEGEDWLDKLDNHQELKSEEENELQQLEKFHENQAKEELRNKPAVQTGSAPSDQALPETAPTDAGEIPPPPPDEFSADEPAADIPTVEQTIQKNAEKAATAPQSAPEAPAPSAPAEGPVDENSVEGLPPL